MGRSEEKYILGSKGQKYQILKIFYACLGEISINKIPIRPFNDKLMMVHMSLILPNRGPSFWTLVWVQAITLS
jgi:hypothetical protein